METTDFGNSYMTWSAPHNFADTRKPGHMPWGNAARIMIDARCTILDSAGNLADELYLIAPCRTEWMYQETGMIQNPSGEYRQIFSEPHGLQKTVGKSITETGPIAHGPAISTSIFDWIEFTLSERPSRQARHRSGCGRRNNGLCTDRCPNQLRVERVDSNPRISHPHHELP